jgi:exoribonuclease II
MADTYILFDEDGGFKTGTIMTEAQGSLQVEHASGKRAKIKAAQIFLRFSSPSPSDLLRDAQAMADAFDIDFLWECAPQDEFDFKSLAQEYFGHAPTATESAAILMRLHAAPVYFYRKGRGLYKPAPPDTLKAALAGIERKRLAEEQMQELTRQMVNGELPEAIRNKARQLVFKPDKQSIEFKAVDAAGIEKKLSANHLLLELGAFSSAKHLMQERFLAEHFPRTSGFEFFPPEPSCDWQSLPLSPARTFSIDDSSTTEIDDCLSVQKTETGWRVGVHIAAPGVAMLSGGEFDLAARDRMSTVYMPGEKITMLPESFVATYSLDAGKTMPALSLYADVDEACSAISASHSVLERIEVAANLRHDQLDGVVTEEFIEGTDTANTGTAVDAFAQDLRTLWKLTLSLCKQREVVRGKPEPRFRSDFSFAVIDDKVEITQRRRDAPLDRIVAEMMILANSSWGLLLAENKAPGIYRSQTQGRVRMSTHPIPHQGLGVAQYMWSTSPLRRYTDMVNQRQLIAVLNQTTPPFAPKDAELFSIISAFDAKYDAYNEHQQMLERYWSLRWVQQEHGDDAPDGRRLQAVVVRDDLLRLAHAPFYFRLAGIPQLAGGRRVWVEWIAIDELLLEMEARFIGVDEEADTELDDAAVEDELPESEIEEEMPLSAQTQPLVDTAKAETSPADAS